MHTKLHVYDFDGTLFRSPEKPNWWTGGWWGNLNSLTEPCVPEHPSIEWWNESVVRAAKQSLANPDVRTILMTGRIPKFSLRLKELLKQVGLHFDEMYLCTGGKTEEFKLKTLKAILAEESTIRGVALWEDRAPHLRMFADWVESNGRACIPHLVTVPAHPIGCPPPEERTASDDNQAVQRVAARYKSKTKDEEGNVHYEYSERQVQNRHNEKAKRVEQLRKDLKNLRKKVKTDLTSKDDETALAALAAALIDETCERVGNDESAKEGHFGVTGWQKSHVSFKGGKAILKYVGKSGVDHEKTVEDAAVVKLLKELAKDKKDKDCLLERDGFRVKPEQVNEYLKEFGITAKDIRGLRANQEMCLALKDQRKRGPELPRSRKERDKILKKEFADALDEVADIVGHESATLRSDYLVPGLEDSFMKDGTVISTFKEATKSDAEWEDEGTAELVKPSPKLKPPRDDLRKHRVESDDPDINAEDDDLSLNFKKVAATRIAMAMRIAAIVRVAARFRRAKDNREDEFLEYVKDKRFTNPKNPDSEQKVKFKTLPKEEQKRIRQQYMEDTAPDEEEESESEPSEEGEGKPESTEETPEKEETPEIPEEETPKERKERLQKEKEDIADREQGDADEKREWEKKQKEIRRQELNQNVRHIKDSPALSDSDSDFVERTLDSMMEGMSDEEAEDFANQLVATRDVGIEQIIQGKSPLRGKPPKLSELKDLVAEHKELSSEIDGLERSFSNTAGERIEKLKKKQEGLSKKLRGDFSKFYAHAALSKATRNPLTYLSDTSTPLDDAGTRKRAAETTYRYRNMTPEDRQKSVAEFAAVRESTDKRIQELEEALEAGTYASPDRDSNETELANLRNRKKYLDVDQRSLDIAAAVEGDDTEESSIQPGTRKLLKTLKNSGVEVSDMLEAGLGVPGTQPEARIVGDLVKKMHPAQLEETLEALDPRLAKSWKKLYEEDDPEDYRWPFNKIQSFRKRKDLSTAFDIYTELLTDVAVEDAKSDRQLEFRAPKERSDSGKGKDWSKFFGEGGPSRPGESGTEYQPYQSPIQDALSQLTRLDID